MNESIEEIIASLTGDELVELGVGLIARGMFRSREAGISKNEIVDMADSALNVIRNIKNDFRG